MEVVPQPETANTVESRLVEDPPSLRFTWRITNFSRLTTKKLYSEIFAVGGHKWRVLIFPKGNRYLSMYLDVADSASLPCGWSRYAQFSLAVINQIRNKYTVRKDTQHQFNARESDWGFTSFMPLGELYDPSRGYLVNDTFLVEAEVLVRRIVDYRSYDSKETGYVGEATINQVGSSFVEGACVRTATTPAAEVPPPRQQAAETDPFIAEKLDQIINLIQNLDAKHTKQFLVLRTVLDSLNIRLHTLEGQMATLLQRMGIAITAPQVEDVLNMAKEAAVEATENEDHPSPSLPTAGPTDNASI